jgi:hypothetical protein
VNFFVVVCFLFCFWSARKVLRIAVLSLFVSLKHVRNVLSAMGSSSFVLMWCDGCWRFVFRPFC